MGILHFKPRTLAYQCISHGTLTICTLFPSLGSVERRHLRSHAGESAFPSFSRQVSDRDYSPMSMSLQGSCSSGGDRFSVLVHASTHDECDYLLLGIFDFMSLNGSFLVQLQVQDETEKKLGRCSRGQRNDTYTLEVKKERGTQHASRECIAA